jgi:hypothetical protein
MYVCFTNTYTTGWTSFIFSIQEFIHPRLVLVNWKIPAPKREAPEVGPRTQNGNFLENSSNDFD